MTHTAAHLADAIDAEVSWLTVRTADRVPGSDWISCAALLEEQAAGGDPTYEWRRVLQDAYARDYAVEPPVQVAAMFVLSWYVQVPSIVAAVASAVTGESPEVMPESLAFRRHPGGQYPAEIALLSPRVVAMPEAAQQLAEHTTAFTASYLPEVKLGSRQRRGAVEDEVRAALRMPAEAPYADQAAAAFGIDLGQLLRTSCCFIYALPKVRPCAGCPRAS